MANLSTTADDILRCARSLIVEGGYNGFSYADISEVVGIRKASIHHHFPTKADLVSTLVTQYRQEAEAGLAALERNVHDPAKALRAYSGYWEACIADATAPFCVCALLATQIPALPEAVVVQVRAHFRMLSSWLTALLDRGAQEGLFRLLGTAEAEAETFMAIVHGAMLSARAYGDTGTFGSVVRPAVARLTAAS